MELDEELNIDFSMLKNESKQVIAFESSSINRDSPPTMRLSSVKIFELYL